VRNPISLTQMMNSSTQYNLAPRPAVLYLMLWCVNF